MNSKVPSFVLENIKNKVRHNSLNDLMQDNAMDSLIGGAASDIIGAPDMGGPESLKIQAEKMV